MPRYPNKTESQDDYMGYCVSYLKKEEDKTQDQAVGQCLEMWRNRKKHWEEK